MREAIIRLSDRELEAIGLDGIVAAVREAGLKDVRELGPEGIHQARLEEPVPEEDLERFDAVEWWERVDESADGVTYLWKLACPCHDGICPLEEYSIAHEVSGVHDRGFDLSVIGSKEEISQSVERMAEAGLNVQLERFTEYTGSSSTMDRLTDRQREVVRTAYAMGYYDVPRVTSIEDLAEEVGLDSSTVAEHLQRAERNLMGQIVVPRSKSADSYDSSTNSGTESAEVGERAEVVDG